jgi:dihydroorotate dehydrogenase electron transfer subunit
MFQGKVRIIANDEIMPSVYLLRVAAPEVAATAAPGQFVMISADSGSARLLRRPISLHQVKGGKVSFLYASIGRGTEWLAGCRAGMQIDILGPMGRGFTRDSAAYRLLLIAGGMGIAPLCYLAEDRLARGCQVKLLAGAKTASLLYPSGLIPSGSEVITATEDGSAGFKGMITSLMKAHLSWADRVFICGPLPMYQAIQRDLQKNPAGIPVEVSLEVRMGCGLGFCYACTIPTTQGLKQVCKDGPVFPLAEVIWSEMK